MRVPYKQTAHRILLVLCVIFFVCLLLTRPVNEKQSEDTGARQQAQIPPGMKISTVPVSYKTIPDKSLLCPDCIVDVQVSLKQDNGKIRDVIPDFIVDALIKCKLIKNRKRNALSVTMLRGIQVLSIKRGVHGTFVNLLVAPKQAEALKLAMKNSNISLTVRDPNDFRKTQPGH